MYRYNKCTLGGKEMCIRQKSLSRFMSVILSILIVCCWAPSVFAQGTVPTVTISGMVTGPTGAIEGLHVNIENPDTWDWVAGTMTDSTGWYSVRVPLGGDYQVNACASCSDVPFP